MARVKRKAEYVASAKEQIYGKPKRAKKQKTRPITVPPGKTILALRVPGSPQDCLEVKADAKVWYLAPGRHPQLIGRIPDRIMALKDLTLMAYYANPKVTLLAERRFNIPPDGNQSIGKIPEARLRPNAE
jgi:hypothetical protein